MACLEDRPQPGLRKLEGVGDELLGCNVAAICVDEIVFDRRVPRDPSETAVPMETAVLEARELIAGGSRSEPSLRQSKILGMDKVEKTSADDLAWGVAQNMSPSWTDRAEDAVDSDDHY